jgi:hypothetical protein
MDASKLTPGQRAYEAKRAAKAGMSLDAWLKDKERRAREEVEEARKAEKATAAAPAKKPGFFQRLLERAQKPL